MNPIPIAAAAAAVLTLSLPADEVRLRDGRVLVGKVESVADGSRLTITTRFGDVEVAADQVVRIRDDEALRQELAQLEQASPPSAFRDFNLARTAFGYGLEEEMWRWLDATLQPRSRDRVALRGAMLQRVRDFLATLEPEILEPRWRRAPTDVRVRELLARVRPKISHGRHAAILELLAREPEADEALRVRARRATSHAHRITALEALGRRSEIAGNREFVYRTAILDIRREVRRAATDVIRMHDDTESAVDYLAAGLEYPIPAVRIRTAEAMANMGDLRAAPLLVAAGPAAGRLGSSTDPGTRGNVAFIDQQAFMRDFDVEVASASFIADPQIDVLQSGMVLDATVHATSTERLNIVRAYRTALRSLVDDDPGGRTKKWSAWWAEHAAADESRTAETGAREEDK